MADDHSDFRQKLFDAEEITPALREAYRRQMDTLLHDNHTPRKRLIGAMLLLAMVAGVIGEIRALFVYPGDARFYVAATAMAIAFAGAAVWIARDLWHGKTVRKLSYKVSDLFYGAAGILTVMQLLHGMNAPAEPASTFGVLFMFVFLFVCGAWSLLNRVSAAELSIREELLRIECRMADAFERMN